MISKYLILMLLILLSFTLLCAEQYPFPEPEEDFQDPGVAVQETTWRRELVDKLNAVLSPELTVFFVSMLPIFELRGAIPLGINHFKLNPFLVFLISVTGNMVPIFLILLFLDGVTKLCYRVPFLRYLLEQLFQRTRHRSKIVEKYQELGLVIFVAIPLPVTGAWTGSLAAHLLGLNFWKSIIFIFFGVLIAGIVVTTLSLLGWWGAIIALTILLVLFLRKAMQMMNNNHKNKRNEGTV